VDADKHETGVSLEPALTSVAHFSLNGATRILDYRSPMTVILYSGYGYKEDECAWRSEAGHHRHKTP